MQTVAHCREHFVKTERTIRIADCGRPVQCYTPVVRLGSWYSPHHTWPSPFKRRHSRDSQVSEGIRMTFLRAVTVIGVVLVSGLGVVSAQKWTRLTNQPTFFASTAFILTDGRVMVQDEGAQDWWALTPDAKGSYLKGTWSQLASLPTGYSPLYYASTVLPDGRVAIIGGEYNFGVADWTTLGAIYNPKTNTWKTLGHPTG